MSEAKIGGTYFCPHCKTEQDGAEIHICQNAPKSASASANLEEIADKLIGNFQWINNAHPVPIDEARKLIIHALQSALAPVQAELEQANRNTEFQAEAVGVYQSRLTQAEAARRDMAQKLAKAEADTRRLDWLEEQGRASNISGLPTRSWVIEAQVWENLRSAIDDNAIAAQAKP